MHRARSQNVIGYALLYAGSLGLLSTGCGASPAYYADPSPPSQSRHEHPMVLFVAPVAEPTVPPPQVPSVALHATPPLAVASSTLPHDPRQFALRRRSVPLLVTELSQLSKLKDVTSPNASDRPLILRRIAEQFAELAYAADADQQPALRDRSSLAAAAMYSQLRAAWPTDPHGDEVLYFLALEQLRENDSSAASATYSELKREYPNSRYLEWVPPLASPSE